MEVDKENWHYLKWSDSKKPLSKVEAKILNGEFKQLEFSIGSSHYFVKDKTSLVELKRVLEELLNFLTNGEVAEGKRMSRKLRPKSDGHPKVEEEDGEDEEEPDEEFSATGQKGWNLFRGQK